MARLPDDRRPDRIDRLRGDRRTLGAVSWRAPFLLYLVGIAVLAAGIFTLPEPRRKADRGTPSPRRDAVSVALGRSGRRRDPARVGRVLSFRTSSTDGYSEISVRAPPQHRVADQCREHRVTAGGVTYRYVNRPSGWYFGLMFLVWGIGYIGLALVPNYLAAVPFDGIANFGAGLIPTMIA